MKSTTTPVAALLMLALVGCSRMSEQIHAPEAGWNGGFEQSERGLPVQWIVYSPDTIPTGSYELLFDTTERREGEQSLEFVVAECSATGGWQSPGIAQEVPADPGTHALRFWIRSDGCDWTVSFGGVTAKQGEFVTVDSSEVDAADWREVERRYTLRAPDERLRFELSIRSPGRLWIDDVRIERVADDESRDVSAPAADAPPATSSR
jgi:hypothetical protein